MEKEETVNRRLKDATNLDTEHVPTISMSDLTGIQQTSASMIEMCEDELRQHCFAINLLLKLYACLRN